MSGDQGKNYRYTSKTKKIHLNAYFIILAGTTGEISITATFAGLATPQEEGAGDRDGDQEEEEEGTDTSPVVETQAVQETSAALPQTTLTS